MYLKSTIRKAALLTAGGLLGYAYYYFIGCNSGSCPISSNPVISSLYGMLVGGIIAFSK